MKKYFIALLMLAFMQPLFAQNAALPVINQKIIKYLDSVIGKKVDRGECWDLANQALTVSGAYFDRSTEKTIHIFGKEVDPEKDEIFPGDILQFSKVKLQYEQENAIITETMANHTALVYEVLGKGHYRLAHQNTSFSGKKVGLSQFRLQDVKSGKIQFYRPYKK